MIFDTRIICIIRINVILYLISIFGARVRLKCIRVKFYIPALVMGTANYARLLCQ